MTGPDGRIHLVSRNLNSQTAMPVLLHEAFHAGAEPLIGEAAWERLIRRVERIHDAALWRAAQGEEGGWWGAALARLPQGAGAEELAAYAIENRETAPSGLREIVDNLVGRVKAFILRPQPTPRQRGIHRTPL